MGGGWFGVLGYRLGAPRRASCRPTPPAPDSAARPCARLPRPCHPLRRRALVVRGAAVALASRARRAARALAPRARPARAGARAAAPGRVRAARTRRGRASGGGRRVHRADRRRRAVPGEPDAAAGGRLVGHRDRASPRAPSAVRSRFGAFVEGPSGASSAFRRSGSCGGSAGRCRPSRSRAPPRTRRSLLASTKDAAEHVMIVDLMRNDLGRVCAYGTIEAHPPRVEPHANVCHLVSSVTGTLRDEAGDADLLRATFPPGSVTGAPKVQSLKVISELEATRREAYTGAIGYASPVAGLELNVGDPDVRDPRRAHLAGGRRRDRRRVAAGGRARRGARQGARAARRDRRSAGPSPPAAPRVPRALPRALDHGPRPDPSHGLLETILVIDGRPGPSTASGAAGSERSDRVRPPGPGRRPCRSRRPRRGATGPCRVRVVATPAPKAARWRSRSHRSASGAETDGADAVRASRWPGRAQVGRPPPGRRTGGRGRPRRHRAARGRRRRRARGDVGQRLARRGRRLVTPPADGRLLAGIGRDAAACRGERGRGRPRAARGRRRGLPRRRRYARGTASARPRRGLPSAGRARAGTRGAYGLACREDARARRPASPGTGCRRRCSASARPASSIQRSTLPSPPL